MNTTLNLNSNSIAQSHPADQTNTIGLPAFARWIRAIARYFAPGDDPAAIYYMESKYGGARD